MRTAKFSNAPVTHSMVHHLVAVADLVELRGYARVTDLGRELGLTRGSVSLTMKGAVRMGLAKQDENRFYTLTAEGTRLVASVR